jgi:quinol monooxygenase YgiN
MLTITAVIRAKKGHEGALQEALLDVARHVRANEPDTLGFFISRDATDPTVFTTYERFTDRAAMDRHNGSDVVAKFFAIAQPILAGAVTLVTCEEIFAKA